MKAYRATEAECQRTIVAAAHAAGWWVHTEHTGMTARGAHLTRGDGRPGWPDLILVHPFHELLWAIELKRKPNKVTTDQFAWMDQLARWADRAEFVYVPDDMDAFIKQLVNPLEPLEQPT